MKTINGALKNLAIKLNEKLGGEPLNDSQVKSVTGYLSQIAGILSDDATNAGTLTGVTAIESIADAVENIDIGGGGGDELAIGLISRVLPNEVIVPDGVTFIGTHAFEGCSGVKTIRFPETVEQIKQYAFKNCYSLENIVTPNSCTTIDCNGPDGGQTFSGCSNLKYAYFSNVTTIIINTWGSEYDSLVFDGAGSYLYSDNRPVIVFPKIQRIAKAMFKGCNAREIYIGADCAEIASDAFASMQNTSATINCGFAEGAVEGAPWGATSATINYNVPVPNVED